MIFSKIDLGAGRWLTLRPERPADEPMLLELFAGARHEELALTGWDEATRAWFIQSQFQAQRSAYRTMFPGGDFAILELESAPAGRVVVNQTPQEIRLVDIVIAPGLRNRGFGSAVLCELMAEGARQKKPVRLHVLQNNRAATLYRRLGFRPIGAEGVYEEMEWPAVKEPMPASLKLPLAFDAVGLQTDLRGILAGEFIPHFNKGCYEGDWSVAPLRSVGGRADHIYPDPMQTRNFADTPLLARCPSVRLVLAAFRCELQAVRFLRLKAGSVIKEHRDFQLGYEDGEARLHIPVLTNPSVEFILDGQRIVMNPGELWYCNFNLPHRVANKGQTDRVHLVLDCFLNGWLRGLFHSAQAGLSGAQLFEP